MTEELKQAAQQALEEAHMLILPIPAPEVSALDLAKVVSERATKIATLLTAILTQRPAAQTEREAGPRVLREVFALCEDTMDKMAAESTEFSRGRAFEAKGISRAIGTWFQDEYCGRSYMGEPSLPAHQQATPEPVGEPALWVPTKQLDQRETTTRGYLWFSNPQNDLWTPLYTNPAPGVPEPTINWFGTHFTYQNQPCDNVTAWRFGEAAMTAKPGGDLIDHGLSLLHELEKRGYGIYVLAAAQAKGGEHG